MGTRQVTLREPDGFFSVLELPAEPATALIQAAAGVVAAAPGTDGRARALELLQAGGESAAVTAAWVLREALKPAVARG
jgi:hypothetical protein